LTFICTIIFLPILYFEFIINLLNEMEEYYFLIKQYTYYPYSYRYYLILIIIRTNSSLVPQVKTFNNFYSFSLFKIPNIY